MLNLTLQKVRQFQSIPIRIITIIFIILIIFCTVISPLALAQGKGIGSSQSLLLSGTTDTSSPITNAVVSVNGCTGTLITNRIVLTAGHCVDGENLRSRQSGQIAFPHNCANSNDWQNPDRWYNFNQNRTFQVRFGLDQTNPSNTFTASQYSLPGCVDIIMLLLTQPVPTSVAIPVAVATNASVLDQVRNANLQMVGFGTTGLDDLIELSFTNLRDWNRTALDSTPPWRVRTHAHGTRGLAIVGDNMFSAGTNFLWMRPVGVGNIAWQKIGDVPPSIVSMTAVGNTLYAATSDNRLIISSATPTNISWRDIGHANNIAGMTSIGNRLFAATKSNNLWVRNATVLSDIAWRKIGHANNIADLAYANGMLYGITRQGLLWSRTGSTNDVNWQYIGDMYYRGTWDHDNNNRTDRIDSVDRPRNIVASNSDIYISIRTTNGRNLNGFYPTNSWPLRQTGVVRFGRYQDEDREHFTINSLAGTRVRPGDSGGPLFWLRPGQSRVLIGVARQTHKSGGRYAATFFNKDPRVNTNNTGLWIQNMANPAEP
ncbi:MAG: trypsin-like serine protease [Cellvibrionaceae bacterium]